MTVAVDRPLTSPSTRTVSITLTVDLPASSDAREATLLADSLHSHALKLATAKGGTARVQVASESSPRPSRFTAVPGQSASASIPPRPAGKPQALRPRKAGVVSPNAPARRDAEAARLRLIQSRLVSPVSAPGPVSALSPASPSRPGGPGARPAQPSLVIDLYGRRVRIDGEDVDLTHREFELLAHLARNARCIVSRGDLMSEVWSSAGSDAGERTVDVHIRRVRNKLGRYRKLISTVRGSGYRLELGSDVALLGAR
ncbi:winged helix-turn-helix domain-containing protein [Dermabacter hominis]|uniref:winged helix-turn-helix domain-containing protein n=1 Tax=Dermabacter hominis TaxID=36740 RepID=UPI0021A43269|nr:winged helix-turn-helix domain-containing protein [Dermabacter hominis]MCT2056250.1 winged helix-turn-helix domain-containing protein [Dermabacter hominis]MCT2083989.1 winged helix-turn-helix domain-containing protein [Dermabacter hominis]MCT2091742.1 winged helix-turn-helix domain-containing protein [Dermabacter hominis]MCT2190785.1 winged helix-turn-helix domain-containing protein [Dermabacter hominis]MCT2227241.1 winged helix-turn-helix domain-containing protein [Dermabacter hominis]